MKPGDHVEITATEMADSGAGRGEARGYEIEVEGLCPGESGTVAITSVSRHHPRAFAKLDQRTGPPSAARQKPACPAFKRCGGCSWQHVSYAEQLAHKRLRAQRDLPGRWLPAVIGAASELGYRNKASYVLGTGTGGEVILGARAPRSSAIVDTRGCRVVEPSIDSLATRLGEVLDGLDLRVGCDLEPPALRYAVIRAGAAGELLLGLVTHSGFDERSLERIADELEGVADTVVHVENDETSGSVLGRGVARTLRGPGTVPEVLSNATVEASIDSFVQVHRGQAQRIYERVRDWCVELGAATALDLYCGLGGFAFALASAGIEVTAIERSADAEAASRAILGGGAMPSFRRGDAATAAGLDSPEMVIVNPPRKGLAREVHAALLQLAPPHIVYVSCGPKSLARDLDELERGGYKLIQCELYDLMPGTPHVEVATLLSRPRT